MRTGWGSAVGAPGFDGGRLRAARRAAGLTQQQLAARLGVPATGVANWENGYRSPRADRLRELARLVGVEPAGLVGSSTDPTGPRDAVLEHLQAAAEQYADAYRRARAAGWTQVELRLRGFGPPAQARPRAADAAAASPTDGTAAGPVTGAARGTAGRPGVQPHRPTLALLRTYAGMLQEQVASAAGLTRTKYSALERGEIASLSDGDCRALAAAFGVPVGEVRVAHANARADFLAQLRAD